MFRMMFSAFWSLLVLTAIAFAGQAHAAHVDYTMLEVDGITDETEAGVPKGVKGFKLGSMGLSAVQTAVHAAGGGGGAGKVQFEDIAIEMITPGLDTEFFLRCVTGEHTKQMVITMYAPQTALADRGAVTEEKTFVITLEDVLVSKFELAQSSEDPAHARASLNFAKIKIERFKGGKLISSAGWDVKANKTF